MKNNKKKYNNKKLNNKVDQILYNQKIIIKNQSKCECLIEGISVIDKCVIEEITPVAFLNGDIESNYIVDENRNIKSVKMTKSDGLYAKLLKYIKTHKKKALTTLFLILINYSTMFFDLDLTLVGILIELLF